MGWFTHCRDLHSVQEEGTGLVLLQNETIILHNVLVVAALLFKSLL